MLGAAAQLGQAFNRLDSDKAVGDATNDLMIGLLNCETGQRGFIITGKEEYLQPYTEFYHKVPNYLLALKDAARSNDQSMQVEEITELVNTKLVKLEKTISIRRDEGFDAARSVLADHQGKTVMDVIRSKLSDLKFTVLINYTNNENIAHYNAMAAFFAMMASMVSGIILVWKD